MPTSLSRLSSCLSSILSFLECPICFVIISPPAHQCPLGHLICYRCREEIERCPVCRTPFARDRSLLADQIYNSVIEAFHLKDQTTEERTKKLWERVFGKKKPRTNDPASRTVNGGGTSTPKLKNKFLTRLIGKASSVDNLPSSSGSACTPNESSAFTPNLRKKSISSCDLYPSSAKRLNYMYESPSIATATQCSAESLPTNEEHLSRFSSSCDGLSVGRSIQYYHRPRTRNFSGDCGDAGTNAAENLFQFSSNNEFEESSVDLNNLYRCPVSEQCSPMSSFSLMTHLREHEGPVIQYFKSNFTINFPFSFGNGVLFIINCYEKSFFLKMYFESNNDIKLYIWILGTKEEAQQFKVTSTVRGLQFRTELTFTTYINSILSTDEPSDSIYNNQILITDGTLENCFPDKSYLMNLQIIQS